LNPGPRQARRRARLGALCLAVAAVSGCDGPGELRQSSPAPAGSQLPHLAMRADGAPVLSWVEPAGDGHRLAFAVLTDGAWSAPGSAAEGRDWFVNWADVPSVVPLHDTLWAAHWLVKRPGGMYAYDISLATSMDEGRTWGQPFRPHDDDTPTEHGFVSLWPAHAADGTPVAGAVWLDGRHMLLDAAASTPREPRMALRSAIFDAAGHVRNTAEVDPRVCECCRTAATPIEDGVVVAYRDRSAEEVRDVAVATRRGGAWQHHGPAAIDGWSITGCPVNGPALAGRDGDLAVAWYTDADGARQVRVARRLAGDSAWSPPVDGVPQP
jgi:hypothetical protein